MATRLNTTEWNEGEKYQALAVAVIEQALVEAAWQPRMNLMGRLTGALGEKDRARVEAEAFLWRRDDSLVRLWFGLAGISLESFRASAATAEARQAMCVSVRVRLALEKKAEVQRARQARLRVLTPLVSRGSVMGVEAML
jgi:hypothetical protein